MNRVPRDEIHFSFSRSSGAGGQNVNKVNSKATLHWNLAGTKIPFGIIQRFRERFAGFITQEGEVQITSQESRNQKDNVESCFAKLEEMLAQVWRPPKVRKPTRPTRASVERRLQSKRRESDKKRQRRGE
jgi:ribosome-associated protein